MPASSNALPPFEPQLGSDTESASAPASGSAHVASDTTVGSAPRIAVSRLLSRSRRSYCALFVSMATPSAPFGAACTPFVPPVPPVPKPPSVH
jgi:hypothetical protein